ncbi:MAG: ABC transporter permease [Chryseolinea sp.]
MFRNYILTASRILSKNKTTSLISIFGLVVAITASVLIGLYVFDELNFDQHFSNKHRIYRAVTSTHKGNELSISAKTSGNVASALMSEFPEVTYASRILSEDEGFIFSNGAAFKEKLLFTDSNFLNVFPLHLLVGNKRKCLTDPSSILLSKSFALKLYGDRWKSANILGSTILIDGTVPMNVTGVFEDFPVLSHFSTNLLASVPFGEEKWMSDDSQVYTYLLVANHTNFDNLHAKVMSAAAKFFPGEKSERSQIVLQSLSDVHLNVGFVDENARTSNVKNIYALVGVGILLIIISVVNFVNLFVVSAVTRIREMGIRRAIGAHFNQLRVQFLTEASILVFLAVSISLIIIVLWLPTINRMMDKNFTVLQLLDFRILTILTMALFGVPIIASAYPIFYLSRIGTIEALAGQRHDNRSGVIGWRRGLLAVQLSICSIMITLSIVAWRQSNFIMSKSVGFEKENILILSNPYMLGKIDKILHLREELSRVEGVENITITGYTPSQNRWGTQHLTFPEQNENSPFSTQANWLMVDENFLATLGINLFEGRNFMGDHVRDGASVIINETAARRFGLLGNGTAVGHQLSIRPEGERALRLYNVIGVVKDFNFSSLYEPVKPIVMKLGYHRFEMALRMSPGDKKSKTILGIERVWEKHLPIVPFEYAHMKTRFDEQHRVDIIQSNLFSIICFAIILMSSFGLFTMSTHTVINRSKEIGIRKVLGASAYGISILIGREFFLLVVTAFLLTVPIAWKFCSIWLEHFAYRIEISWTTFLISFIAVAGMGVTSLGYALTMAFIMRPVTSLRGN